MDTEILKKKREVEEEIKQILMDFYADTAKSFILTASSNTHYSKIPELGDETLPLSTSFNVTLHIFDYM